MGHYFVLFDKPCLVGAPFSTSSSSLLSYSSSDMRTCATSFAYTTGPSHPAPPGPRQHCQPGPYFIRLSAMQDARVSARRREEHLRATDLPPKYEDLVGYTNLGATDDKDQDMFLPDYSECVVDTSEHYNAAADWPDHHQNTRPGRF
eukprot:TRINITY_DN25455_c0_g1_i1.p1 TRINITY_DN25455_c0_g1~~TRINITY_DN25455_c0_g1_i1.p1  ORF type:complete len:155 (-),score=41.85 TRINITY_DN25455_c0_g1_i1:153-593(-)